MVAGLRLCGCAYPPARLARATGLGSGAAGAGWLGCAVAELGVHAPEQARGSRERRAAVRPGDAFRPRAGLLRPATTLRCAGAGRGPGLERRTGDRPGAGRRRHRAAGAGRVPGPGRHTGGIDRACRRAGLRAPLRPAATSQHCGGHPAAWGTGGHRRVGRSVPRLAPGRCAAGACRAAGAAADVLPRGMAGAGARRAGAGTGRLETAPPPRRAPRGAGGRAAVSGRGRRVRAAVLAAPQRADTGQRADGDALHRRPHRVHRFRPARYQRTSADRRRGGQLRLAVQRLPARNVLRAARG